MEHVIRAAPAQKDFAVKGLHNDLHYEEDLGFSIALPIESDANVSISSDEKWIAVWVQHHLFYAPLTRGAVLVAIQYFMTIGHHPCIESVAWGKNKLFFCASEWMDGKDTHKVYIFDLGTRALRLGGRFAHVSAMVGSADGTTILLQHENVVTVYDGTFVEQERLGNLCPAPIAWFGNTYVVPHEQGILRLPDRSVRIPTGNEVTALAFSPDGGRVAFASGYMYGIVDIESEKVVCMTHHVNNFSEEAEVIQWTPFGIVFISDGTMTVWTDSLQLCDKYSIPTIGYCYTYSKNYTVAMKQDNTIHVCSSYEGSNRIRKLTALVGLMAVRRNMVRRETCGGIVVEIEEDAKPALRLISRFLY